MLFHEVLASRSHPALQGTGICEPLQIATERLIDQWAKASRRVAQESPEMQAEVSALKIELKYYASTRNILVHGFWDYPSPEQNPNKLNVQIVKPTRSGETEFTRYEIDYQTLAEFHDSLARLYHRIVSLTLHGVFCRLPQRPKAEPTEAVANPASDSSLNPAPNQTPVIGLFREREQRRPVLLRAPSILCSLKYIIALFFDKPKSSRRMRQRYRA